MIRVVVLGVAAALAASAGVSAFADSRTEITRIAIAFCMNSDPMRGVLNAEEICVCQASVVSDLASDRQYAILGRTLPHFHDAAAFEAEHQRLLGKGYTEDELLSLGPLLADATRVGDATCPVKRK
jgi:hypothetical protein